MKKAFYFLIAFLIVMVLVVITQIPGYYDYQSNLKNTKKTYDIASTNLKTQVEAIQYDNVENVDASSKNILKTCYTLFENIVGTKAGKVTHNFPNDIKIANTHNSCTEIGNILLMHRRTEDPVRQLEYRNEVAKLTERALKTNDKIQEYEVSFGEYLKFPEQIDTYKAYLLSLVAIVPVVIVLGIVYHKRRK